MFYHSIILTKADGVAVIQMNNPKAMNALEDELSAELLSAYKDVAADPAVGAVILTGAEKAFCAGGDLKKLNEGFPTAEAGYDYMKSFREMVTTFLNMPKPTIAAVNGFALGGGCELAMACDIRIAADTAVFGQPECGLGILPGFGGTQRLPRLIGKGRAKELIFTCDRIDAQEAYRIGLANKVVPKEELMAACETMARKILSKGSYAVTLAKACVESGMDMDIENGLRMEATTFGMSFATHDKAEGMRAFLEKRPAQFTD